MGRPTADRHPSSGLSLQTISLTMETALARRDPVYRSAGREGKSMSVLRATLRKEVLSLKASRSTRVS